MTNCTDPKCSCQPDRKQEKVRELEDKLDKIKSWCEAYPVSIFKEPDFKKAARVLKENGMTLDSISASSMRHVLRGVVSIIENGEMR